MFAPILGLIEFFDVAFLRLIFNLAIDYLISAGYLLPEQREQWVQGYAHIIGILGAVIFMAIWQHKGHKKTTVEKTDTTVIQDTSSTEDQPVITEKKEVKIRDLI